MSVLKGTIVQAQILTFIIPGIMAIFAAMLFALWRADRSRTYILAYAYWAFAFCGGIILQGTISWNFAPYDILLFHWNAAIAIIVLLWGVAKRDGQQSPVFAMLALTALTTPVLYFARAYEVQSVLLMTQNFNTGLLFALAAHGKWRIAPANTGDRALVWVFIALAAYAIVRPSITILAQSQMTMAQYQSSVFASVNIVISALLALVLALSLIATIALDDMRRGRQGAVIDGLTKLRNRTAFEKDVKAMLAIGMEEKVPVSLIVCDIDNFKLINDTFGHPAGDAVITRFGQIIAGKIRGSDIAGRVGGEEFCIAVWDCHGDPAARLADRIRLAAANSKARGETDEHTFTVSFGVAERLPGESYASLFKRADAALYNAKNDGRNKVVLDGSNSATAQAVHPISADLPSGAQIVAFTDRKAGQLGVAGLPLPETASQGSRSAP